MKHSAVSRPLQNKRDKSGRSTPCKVLLVQFINCGRWGRKPHWMNFHNIAICCNDKMGEWTKTGMEDYTEVVVNGANRIR